MQEQFVALIRQWINIAIYVLTGQGQTITSESQIRAREDTEANALRAIALWTKRGKNCVCFDCSGLVIWALMQMGLIDHDLRADGIHDLSKPIDRADLQLGDFAFRLDDNGNAHHIGTVTMFVDGVPRITEAKGRDDGVVDFTIDAFPGYWEAFGANPFFVAGGGGGQEMIICQKQSAYSENAKAMHYGLSRLGYQINLAYAGLYGSATTVQVAKFQSDNKLEVNGDVFDDKCNAKMMILLAQLPSVDPATKAELDAAKKKIVSLGQDLAAANNNLLIASNDNAKLTGKINAAKTALA